MYVFAVNVKITEMYAISSCTQWDHKVEEPQPLVVIKMFLWAVMISKVYGWWVASGVYLNSSWLFHCHWGNSMKFNCCVPKFTLLDSLALGQQYDCCNANEITLRDMGEIDHSKRITLHKKSLIRCIFSWTRWPRANFGVGGGVKRGTACMGLEM